MESCKSPRTVFLTAYRFALKTYKDYPSSRSRHDFTQPQLFACLALREHQKKSYRGIEALLRDYPDWCTEIGMNKPPDHGTLHRAFVLLMNRRNLDQLFDGTVMLAEYGRLLGDTGRSTRFCWKCGAAAIIAGDGDDLLRWLH